jgi:hypothetical protein
MPRRLRTPKRRYDGPHGLAAITLLERGQWSVSGPMVGESERVCADTGRVLYHAWPDWQTWATFYGVVRDELHRERPWRRERSVAERLYVAWCHEERDLDGLQTALVAERAANDPRRVLCLAN